MRSEKRNERARQIEAAAYEILEEKGFAGLSIQAISRKARTSNETLYRWYGDKNGLFEALIRGNSANVEAALDASDSTSGLDQLSDVGPVLLTMLLGERAISLNKAAAADTSGVLGRALAREGRNAIAPRIIAIMENALASELLAGAAPQELAEVYFSLLIGDLQIRRATGVLAMPREEYIRKRAGDALNLLQRLYPPANLDAARQSEYP